MKAVPRAADSSQVAGSAEVPNGIRAATAHEIEHSPVFEPVCLLQIEQRSKAIFPGLAFEPVFMDPTEI
tara:strand:- start:192 stop:398 length:207 start_codon:yes stop_codon:yes gene_type:complete